MLAASLQRAISTIIQTEMRDPRLEFVNITKVKVSKDLRHATVYASSIGEESVSKKNVDALRNSFGFIKKKLSKYVSFRIMPQFKIAFDETQKSAEHIEQIIDTIHQNDDD